MKIDFRDELITQSAHTLAFPLQILYDNPSINNGCQASPAILMKQRMSGFASHPYVNQKLNSIFIKLKNFISLCPYGIRKLDKEMVLSTKSRTEMRKNYDNKRKSFGAS